MERNWDSHTLQGEIQNNTATLENILVVSYKGKHTLAVQLCSSTLRIYPSEQKTCVHTKHCTQMFKVSQFTITKMWKQLKRPVGEWLNLLWFIHTEEGSTDNMQQHGWISDAVCDLEEGRLTSLHTVGVHLYDILN